MRGFRKYVFKGHFDRLQREDARRVPDHKRCFDDTAQGLGIVPRQVEDEVERPRGTEELGIGSSAVQYYHNLIVLMSIILTDPFGISMLRMFFRWE